MEIMRALMKAAPPSSPDWSTECKAAAAIRIGSIAYSLETYTGWVELVIQDSSGPLRISYWDRGEIDVRTYVRDIIAECGQRKELLRVRREQDTYYRVMKQLTQYVTEGMEEHENT